jgi:ATP-dependent 26S proteasome regulatory subunit
LAGFTDQGIDFREKGGLDRRVNVKLRFIKQKNRIIVIFFSKIQIKQQINDLLLAG